jgi:hypothetical protein
MRARKRTSNLRCYIWCLIPYPDLRNHGSIVDLRLGEHDETNESKARGHVTVPISLDRTTTKRNSFYKLASSPVVKEDKALSLPLLFRMRRTHPFINNNNDERFIIVVSVHIKLDSHTDSLP